MSKLLSIKEVAHYLSVHVSTLRRWIRTGQFPKPSVDILNTHRWSEEDVKKLEKKP